MIPVIGINQQDNLGSIKSVQSNGLISFVMMTDDCVKNKSINKHELRVHLLALPTFS